MRRQVSNSGPPRWVWVLLLLLTFGGLFATDMDIWLPNADANRREAVEIPVYVSDTSGWDVYSVYTRITFDSTLVSLTDVISGGSLTESWGDPTYHQSNAGEVTISAFGTQALSGSGTLLTLEFWVPAGDDAFTALTFEQIMLNEGGYDLGITDGSLAITNRVPWFDPIADQTIAEESLLELDITAYDPQSEPLQMTIIDLPTGADFTDNGGGDADFSWQPNLLQSGDYTVGFVADNGSYADTMWVNIQVVETLDVWLDDWAIMPGDTQPVGIYANQATDLEIYSVYTRIHSDLSIVQPVGATAVGSSTEDWGEPTWRVLPDGDILVSHYGTTPLEGSEPFIYIEFEATGQLEDRTTLEFVSLMFNEGNPEAVLHNGNLYVGEIGPHVVPVEPITAYEGDLVEFTVTATEPLYQMIYYEATGLPEGSDFTDNGDWTATFTWQTDHTSAGTYQVIVTAENEDEIEKILPVDIEILNVHQSPTVVNPIGLVEIPMNDDYTTVNLNEVFEDLDSYPLDFSVNGDEHIAYVINADTTVTFTPEADWYGLETLYIVAEDETDLTAIDPISIKVVGALDITEDFDHAGALPEDWTRAHSGTTTFQWQPMNDSGDDYSMRVENTMLANSNEKLVSPIYDLSIFTDVQVSFQHDFSPNTACTAYFQVSSNGLTWTSLATYTAATNGVVQFSPGAQANHQGYVQFRWLFVSTSYYAAYWNIDDLYITGVVDDSTNPTQITDLAVDEIIGETVKLRWTPCEDLYFSHYEVYWSTDDEVTTDDPVWNNTDDLFLSSIDTDSTIVAGMPYNAWYWFAIRGVDTSGNTGDFSNVVSCLMATPPEIVEPYPDQDDMPYFTQRNVTVGATFLDDYEVDASSLEYRFDANGNNVWDTEESWQPIVGHADSDSILVRVNALYQVDGDSLKFGFRGQDTMQSGVTYSDDYVLRIDATLPTTVTDLAVTDSTATTVSLSWTPVTEVHFERYVIYYGSHDGINEADMQWSVADDALLSDIATGVTTVTGLQQGMYYRFRILAIDTFGNHAELSNEVVSIPRSLVPLCRNPFPAQDPIPWSTSATVTIGCDFIDYFGIDPTSVEYRIDSNGNGVYDAEETWQNAGLTAGFQSAGRSTPDTLHARIDATFSAQGDDLRYELRGWDIDGYGPTYSGSASAEGIGDDWSVKIDTTPPSAIGAAATGAATSESIEVLWLVSSDDFFQSYEVYYDTEPNVTTEDSVWDWTDDSNMANPGMGFVSSIVRNLDPGQTYYFRVRAVDEAGNASDLSIEVSGTTDSAFPPLAPQNVTIQQTGNDVILTWDAVTQNSNGDPITVGAYNIYAAVSADFPADDGTLIATATENSFTHLNVTLTLDKIFYKVTAIETSRETETRIDRVQVRKLLYRKE